MKGCGRKRSWTNLRYYPGICLEKLRKATKKISVLIAGLRAVEGLKKITLAKLVGLCRDVWFHSSITYLREIFQLLII
jgi:hypothetical protein